MYLQALTHRCVKRQGEKGNNMSAVIYAWPLPHSNRDDIASVTALPKRTKHGKQQALPLEWPETSGANALKPVAPRVGASNPEDFDAQPTSRSELPDARQWSMRIVHALVEVVNGRRPVSQLTRWLTPEVLSQVQGLVAKTAMPTLHVRSINVHETDDGVAELSAVFGTPNRIYALALRLEGLDGRWRATALNWGM